MSNPTIHRTHGRDLMALAVIGVVALGAIFVGASAAMPTTQVAANAAAAAQTAGPAFGRVGGHLHTGLYVVSARSASGDVRLTA